jgi:VWFA-related protein
LTAAPPQNPIFSTTSELVVLHATVKDRKGRYVTDLSRDAFTVFEDKAPQTISFFASDDAPVTVGLLIDSSGSMQSNLDHTIAAARSFVQISNPEDEIFALAFNDEVRPVLPSSAPFTNETPGRSVRRSPAPFGRAGVALSTMRSTRASTTWRRAATSAECW